MNSTTVFLFKRTDTNTPPVLPSFGYDLTYSFSSGTVSGSLEGWTQSLPVTGGTYRWVTSARVTAETDSVAISISAWKAVALLSEDGTSRYTATIYKQATNDPGSPPATDSSYDFAAGYLIPPAGWAVIQPNVTTVNTWAAEYTFIGLDDEVVNGVGYWGQTKIVAVAGIDGQNIHIVTIYKQTDEAISRPTGGSYKFDGDVFVAPSGWSRNMPTVSSTPTYMSTCRFASNDPLEVIVAPLWQYPVAVSRIGLDYVNRFKSFCFKYSAAQPTTPIGGDYDNPIPSGWSDGAPAYVAGQDLWMTSRIFYADNSNGQPWATPVKVTNSATLSSKMQFSEDSSSWHDILTVDDVYMRSGSNDGTGWVYSIATRIKGETGATGETGLTGITLYTWIAYAYDLTGVNGFTTGSPTSEHKCIGIARNKTSATESTDPADYIWSQWVGDTGAPGNNGLTLYTWFAYANSPDGVTDFTTGEWVDQEYIGLAFNKYTNVESTDPADYTWSKFKGTAGTSSSVIISSLQAFKYTSGASIPSPTSIILNADLTGGLTTYAWTYWNGSTWVSLSGTNNAQTYTLAYDNAAWSSDTLRIRCTSGSYYDETSISKLRDGAAGESIKGDPGDPGLSALTVILSNENHSVLTDYFGNNGVYTGSGTTIRLYEGTAELTYNGVGTSNSTWNVTASGSGITAGAISASGIYAAAAVASAITADTATITYTITGKRADGSAISIVKVQSFTRTKAGMSSGLVTLNVGANASISGTTASKNVATAAWDSSVYSTESYANGAWATFYFSATAGHYSAAGFSTNPTANTSLSSLNYGWVGHTDGKLYAVVDGVRQTDFDYGAWTASTVLAVTYDGNTVRWLKDCLVQRVAVIGRGNTFYFDSSIYTNGASITDIRLGAFNAQSAVPTTIDKNGIYTGNLYANVFQTCQYGQTVGSGGSDVAGIKIDSTGIKAYNASKELTVSINADGSASFKGAITATEGSFSGDITSTATITGGTIQTSDEYSKRISISSDNNHIEFYGEKYYDATGYISRMAVIGEGTVDEHYAVGHFGRADSNRLAVLGWRLGPGPAIMGVSSHTSSLGCAVRGLATGGSSGVEGWSDSGWGVVAGGKGITTPKVNLNASSGYGTGDPPVDGIAGDVYFKYIA